MQWVLVVFTILGLLVLLSTWGVWWLFPARRARLEHSAWFAFAPLAFGLLGLIATIIIVLVEQPETVSPALASSGTIIMFNIYNGYRSAEAFIKQRREN